MRTHYGPWQPCWISNQHQKHKSGRGPSSEHFWQVWLISVQRFQRRRFKCEKLTDGRTDGRTTDAYPWQKLTWPMARWAKKVFSVLYIHNRFILQLSHLVNHGVNCSLSVSLMYNWLTNRWCLLYRYRNRINISLLTKLGPQEGIYN